MHGCVCRCIHGCGCACVSRYGVCAVYVLCKHMASVVSVMSGVCRMFCMPVM